LWKETVDLTSEACQHMMNTLEEDVNYFGYSLRNLTFYEPPKAFERFMFQPNVDV